VISRKRVPENSTFLRSVPASETVVKRTFVRLSKIFTRSVMCATLKSANCSVAKVASVDSYR
jgi:hypothetical protein